VFVSGTGTDAGAGTGNYTWRGVYNFNAILNVLRGFKCALCLDMESDYDIYAAMADLESVQQDDRQHGEPEPSLSTALAAPDPSPSTAALSIPALQGNTGMSSQQDHSSREVETMDSESDYVLPNQYFQCRAARDATFPDSACTISGGDSLGTNAGGEQNRVGSFEKNSNEMGNCFHGTRVKKGQIELQQNGSFSFDPATMMCIACETPHPIFVAGETAGFCVSDQNFPANLAAAATDKSCVACIRIESASLSELDEIFSEMFGGIKIPAGTTICVGSASHLHKVGATIYAADWTVLCHSLTSRFPGTNICPLIPVLSDEFPGSLAVSIAALTAWFTTVYSNGNRGLLSVWAEASKIVCKAAMPEDCNPDHEIHHTYAFPASLHPGAKLVPRKIVITGSCRARAPAPDAKANKDLVYALLSQLNAEYLIGFSPGTDPVRTTKKLLCVKDKIKTAILYGNSNVRQCAPALQALGFKVIDRTEIHWDGSEAAAKKITEDVSAHTDITDAAFVFDFLSPVSYRFAQPDGSSAMPVKFSGGFHLLGEVVVAEDSLIRSCIDRLAPALGKMCLKPTILIPPLPRFVFGGCCKQRGHAPGSGTVENAKKMIEQLGHVRKVAKTEVQKLGLPNWWIADTLGALGGEDPLSNLKTVIAPDNVHFSGSGYAKLGGEIKKCIELISKKEETKQVEGIKYHWHGFNSLRGAPGPRSTAPASCRGRGNHNCRGPKGGAGGGGGGGRMRGSGSWRGQRQHPYPYNN